ncbi:MAG: endonuclease domain-containing protein [Burkholderiaceae bacterium]
MRKNQTDAEKRFWMAVRNRQVSQLKFRRQVALGKYIVDFVCFERGLIIELDGGQHADNVEYDCERTRWLEQQGFHVLRFWNNDVMSNLEGVLATVVERTGNPLTQPSPARGEG